MRRALSILVSLAVAAGGLLLLAAADDGDGEGKAYEIELDNAFGLVEGADFKVAGVRAGTITGMELDRRSYRALVRVQISKPGFASMREDATCESKPQSLIGEYFLDCDPGRGRELPDGGRIPVERTGSTVPLDLVGNIQRRPVRERLRLVLGELGAGVAARGPELNDAIRRAVPALRETNRVLRILAEDNRILEQLVRDGDEVLGPLARRRADVSRFVREAEETSRISAERSDDLSGQFRRFPAFLRELRPTMRELGETADAQAASFTALRRSAPRLERFLDVLGPFARSSEPAFGALAAAARRGRGAVEPARATVAALAGAAKDLPELAENLAIILEHEDDRDNAVEPDKRSPGGKGFTGFEALMNYVREQSLAINMFDGNFYMLKAALYETHCSPYAGKEQALDPKLEDCRVWLGPNQPGITTPDPSDRRLPSRAAAHRRTADERRDRPAADRPARTTPGATRAPSGADRAPADPQATPAPGVPQIDPPDLPDVLPTPDLLDFLLGS